MCAVLITHSYKLSFSVPDIFPVGKVNLFGSKMVSWGYKKLFFGYQVLSLATGFT